LITGVMGQDGTYLAELLIEKGYRVIGTSRSGNQPTSPPSVDVRTIDLKDAGAVAALVNELRPAEIYHLSGQSSVGLSFAEPVETFHSIATTTLNLLEAVRRDGGGTRLLVAGSGEVFGDTGGQPATEQTPFRPASPYAAAKAAAADLVRVYRASYGTFASIAFFYNHESTRRPERFVTRKVARGACEIALGLRQKLELGDLSVVRDWGWAPEYVRAAHRILQTEAPDDFVIATGESVTLETFVEAAFAAVGLSHRDHVTTNPAFLRASEVRVMRADPTRAMHELGWRAKTRVTEVAARLVEAERAALEISAKTSV
jgi:GDPmannose 4,6-dehydratase